MKTKQTMKLSKLLDEIEELKREQVLLHLKIKGMALEIATKELQAEKLKEEL